MSRNSSTVSSEINFKLNDYKIPSNNISIQPETATFPHVTNQLSSDLFPKPVSIAPDFNELMNDTSNINDFTAGSFEQFGGGINYKEKYFKYKNKYLSLKRDIYTQGDSIKNKYLSLAKRERDIYTQGDSIKQKYVALKEQLGGTVPVNEQNIYTNIYYSNNGDINKIKEFFLENNNKHYVREIINYINKIDTYVFNNFKKEEKIIFWIAMNDEYIDSKNKEEKTRLHNIKNVAFQFKRLYDNWHTYPKKEIENLEIIKDLSYYFDSI
jgi:hypothetical protein